MLSLRKENSIAGDFCQDFRLLFFQLIARQYEKTSTEFTSKKTFSLWSEVFADVTISSVILNRILHRCTIINIKDGAYRLKERKELMRQKQQIVNSLFEQGSTWFLLPPPKNYKISSSFLTISY